MCFSCHQINSDVKLCVLTNDVIKVVLFGNEQTGTGRFGPDSLNRFWLCAISALW